MIVDFWVLGRCFGEYSFDLSPLPRINWVEDDQRSRVEFCDGTGDPWTPRDTYRGFDLYLRRGASRQEIVHELGHVLHLERWPASRQWPEEKCENFAMVPVVWGANREGLWGLPQGFGKVVKVVNSARNPVEAFRAIAENP